METPGKQEEGAMIRGTILSHIRMGARGFCTEILARDPKSGRLFQLRPRLPPNDNLLIDSFGYDEQTMSRYWVPGVGVGFAGLQRVELRHRRPTHPEDVNYVRGTKVQFYTGKIGAVQMCELAAPFTAASVRTLFPTIVRPANARAYVVAGAVLGSSAGYVRCKFLNFIEGYNRTKQQNEMKAHIIDATDTSYDVFIKDEVLLAEIKAGRIQSGWLVTNPFLRLALAGPILVQDEMRCYLMLSHLVQ